MRGQCPECGAEFQFEAEQLGRHGRCYACQKKFVIERMPASPRRTRSTPPLRPIIYGSILALVLVGGIVAARFAQTSQPPARSARPPQVSSRCHGLLGDTLTGLIAQRQFADMQGQLAAVLQPLFGTDPDTALRSLLQPDAIASLAQHETLRACGPDKLSGIALRPRGVEFLDVFLKSPDWMESFLVSDPPSVSYAQALENLRLLYEHAEGLDHPVYQRMATAFALSAGNMLPYRIVDRFRQTQDAHRRLLLHAGFDQMDVREMRWAIYLEGSAAEYEYLLNDRQTTIGGYFGSCWACWYRGFNDFGDTIQGPLYYLPWRYVWPGWEAARRVGGVCGSLSTFGSHSARVHGVPSAPVGQPGHCAYMIRSGEQWPVAYSVTWPTATSTPGWDGTGYATMNRLYEPVQNDRGSFRRAHHLLWAARYQLDRARNPVRILPGLRYARYTTGVGARLPDFSGLKPDRTGVTDRIDAKELQPDSGVNFGLVWEGEIEIRGTGPVRFVLSSDDASRVLIDGQTAASANCTRDEKVITPTPGKHPFRVELSQGGGPFNLNLDCSGVARFGGWAEMYERAILAQPLNYASWLEYCKTLEDALDVPQERWMDIASRAATTFRAYPEAGWAIARRAMDRAKGSLDPAHRLAFLTESHRKLRQANAPAFETFPYDAVLNWQYDQLGDPKLGLSFFGQLLRIHRADAPNDWTFGQVLNWGQERFSKDPQLGKPFAEMLAAYFRDAGDGMKPDVMRDQIISGIRNAGASGDVASFQLWLSIAGRLLPAVEPRDIFLNESQRAAFPRPAPFPGELLSGKASIKTSSSHDSDRPLSYGHLLSGEGAGGYFDTKGEDNPWAVVQLPGEADLSGIVLVNRYEYESELGWAVPLRVSVSADGRSWTPVANFDAAQASYRVDLAGKNIRARYIKAERLNGTKDRFHLRGFLVYGKRLY